MYEEIGKYADRITKNKRFINIYKSEETSFPSENDDWKKFKKVNVIVTLNVLYTKKQKKYILLMFQKILQIVKSKLLFLMIPNGEKRKANSE